MGKPFHANKTGVDQTRDLIRTLATCIIIRCEKQCIAYPRNVNFKGWSYIYMKRFHTTTKRFYQHYFKHFSN